VNAGIRNDDEDNRHGHDPRRRCGCNGYRSHAAWRPIAPHAAAHGLGAIAFRSRRPACFGSNTGNHHHFYLEASNEVIDMPDGFIRVENLPEPPAGLEISRVDVIVRVRSVRNRR
jgi:hypothetical protein